MENFERVTAWPGVVDAAQQTRVSESYVRQLIHVGKLRAIRTRLGWLVDPASVAAFEAERAAKKAAQKEVAK